LLEAELEEKEVQQVEVELEVKNFISWRNKINSTIKSNT
jgi:hypothetical protein